MIFSRGINFGTDVLSSCNLEIKLHSHVWELRSLNLCKDRIDRKEFCLANFLSLPPPPPPPPPFSDESVASNPHSWVALHSKEWGLTAELMRIHFYLTPLPILSFQIILPNPVTSKNLNNN